jgi:hypothetical protein
MSVPVDLATGKPALCAVCARPASSPWAHVDVEGIYRHIVHVACLGRLALSLANLAEKEFVEQVAVRRLDPTHCYLPDRGGFACLKAFGHEGEHQGAPGVHTAGQPCLSEYVDTVLGLEASPTIRKCSRTRGRGGLRGDEELCGAKPREVAQFAHLGGPERACRRSPKHLGAHADCWGDFEYAETEGERRSA